MIDAVVVGAGPAGALAALTLARAGVRVRLFDRAKFPRDKLCGDTINPGALSILDGLEAPSSPGHEPRSLADRIRARGLAVTGMTVSGAGGVQVTGTYPAGVRGAAIARRELDQLLVEAAVAAGAAFEDGARALAPVFRDGRITGVRLSTGCGSAILPARMVVVAEGRGSRLASTLGLSTFATRPRRWAFGAYFSDIPGLTSRGEMHIRRKAYVGIAPLPGGVVNVCVVRDLTRRGGGGRLEAAQLIRDTAAADPLLRERFVHAHQLTPVTTLGPLAICSVAAGVPGLLLAGDAAGFVDPMTGDGLRFALRGGVLAAKAALSELETGRPAYEALGTARTREFSAKWRMNRLLRALAGSPAALRAASVLAWFSPQPVRQLIRLAGDVNLLPTPL